MNNKKKSSLNYTKIRKKIINFIKKTVKNANSKGVVLGISGGIDSAVVAKLAVEALGKKNVFGYILLCENEKNDIEDSLYLSKSLEIKYKIINLENIYKLFIKNINYNKKEKINETINSNVKARLRMITLYYEAAKKNCLVIGTTNKSEFIIGYYTKYGDGGVDFEPIGDLLKSEIICLAKHINLPDFLINKDPKSGLIKNITDEEELGFKYKDLDKYIKTGCGNKKNIEKIKILYKKNKHKRSIPKIFTLKRNLFLK